MQSPEVQAKIAVLRQKIKDMTADVADYREVVALIRGDRKNAANASEQSKRTKAKAAVPDAKALLADLAGLGGLK